MTDAGLTSSVSASRLTEDWLAVWIGLAIFPLALLDVKGPDLLGWAVTTSVWTEPVLRHLNVMGREQSNTSLRAEFKKAAWNHD
jgi:hypothetical protein